MSLTPWFPADVQPVHVGVYEIDPAQWVPMTYAHWSPAGWGWPATTPAIAVRRDWLAALSLTRGRWRGLTEQVT